MSGNSVFEGVLVGQALIHLLADIVPQKYFSSGAQSSSTISATEFSAYPAVNDVSTNPAPNKDSRAWRLSDYRGVVIVKNCALTHFFGQATAKTQHFFGPRDWTASTALAVSTRWPYFTSSISLIFHF